MAGISPGTIHYRPYQGESDLPSIMALVGSELSEPYVIYTYRYFLLNWPRLAFLAFPSSSSLDPIGVIVCKQDMHRDTINRGYIAMLSVNKAYRKRGIASALVHLSIKAMITEGAEEIVLETEADNASALSFYASMGFLREKRLFRFYMNGKDAFRLVLPVQPEPGPTTHTEDSSSLSPPLPDSSITTTYAGPPETVAVPTMYHPSTVDLDPSRSLERADDPVIHLGREMIAQTSTASEEHDE